MLHGKRVVGMVGRTPEPYLPIITQAMLGIIVSDRVSWKVRRMALSAVRRMAKPHSSMFLPVAYKEERVLFLAALNPT